MNDSDGLLYLTRFRQVSKDMGSMNLSYLITTSCRVVCAVYGNRATQWKYTGKDAKATPDLRSAAS